MRFVLVSAMLLGWVGTVLGSISLLTIVYNIVPILHDHPSPPGLSQGCAMSAPDDKNVTIMSGTITTQIIPHCRWDEKELLDADRNRKVCAKEVRDAD